MDCVGRAGEAPVLVVPLLLTLHAQTSEERGFRLSFPKLPKRVSI